MIIVIIPVFNEENTIATVIKDIPKYIDGIIVIDDGSSDNSAKIAVKNGAQVIKHPKNRGVGASFKTGLNAAFELNPDILINIDADGQFNPRDMYKLIDPIVEKRADFVTASRFMNPNYQPDSSLLKLWGNKLMSILVSKISGQKFHDVSCGFRAYSREALLRLNIFGVFTYTHETFLDFSIKNIPIVEVPIMLKGPRNHGKSKIASNLFKYAFKTIKIIMKTLRDFKPSHLFGFISGLLFSFGGISGIFLLIHYLRTGNFSPHKWAGFLSGFLILLSLLALLAGFILDIFARMRLNQEEMLYYMKRIFLNNKQK